MFKFKVGQLIKTINNYGSTGEISLVIKVDRENRRYILYHFISNCSKNKIEYSVSYHSVEIFFRKI
jgi:hypothetical protein